jgi:hypothetical protein
MIEWHFYSNVIHVEKNLEGDLNPLLFVSILLILSSHGDLKFIFLKTHKAFI